MSTYTTIQKSSLSSCLSEINEKFSGRNVNVKIRNIIGGEVTNLLMPTPAFLFRGENSEYDSMTSSMERLRTLSGLSEFDVDEITSLTQTIGSHLEKHFEWDKRQVAGLLQHYEFPTELIDVSSLAEVAAFFACYKNQSGRGVIAVFPTEKVEATAMIIDLRTLDFAWRPVRQEGYGFFDNDFRNLRDSGFFSEVEPIFYSFPVSDKDVQSYVMKKHRTNEQTNAEFYLEDLHDPTRAIFIHLIDCLVRNDGGFTPKAAEWFANHIPPSPYTVVGLEKKNEDCTFRLGPRGYSTEPYSIREDRIANSRLWSK